MSDTLAIVYSIILLESDLEHLSDQECKDVAATIADGVEYSIRDYVKRR